MNIKHVVISATLILPQVQAYEDSPGISKPFSVGSKISSLGVGIESAYRISPLFSVTGSVNGFWVKAASSSKSVNLDGNVRLLTSGISIGIHPLRNGFKFLFGLFYNGNQLKVNTARLKRTITIHGITFTPQDSSAKLLSHRQRVSPYFGIGFDSPLCENSPWQFTGELGTLFQGDSKVKVRRSAKFANSDILDRYIKNKAKKSGNRFLLKYYPVFGIGMKYCFNI